MAVRLLLPLLAATVAAGGLPGTAQANGIAIGVPTAAAFASPLGLDAPVETTGGSVPVTALGSWELRVRGADDGRLHSTGVGLCTRGSALLSTPLQVWASGAGVSSPGSSSAPLDLSGAAAVLASGRVGGPVASTVPVGVTYRYRPSSVDQLPAACAYALTATFDLSV